MGRTDVLNRHLAQSSLYRKTPNEHNSPQCAARDRLGSGFKKDLTFLVSALAFAVPFRSRRQTVYSPSTNTPSHPAFVAEAVTSME